MVLVCIIVTILLMISLLQLDFVWKTKIPRREICARRRRNGPESSLGSSGHETPSKEPCSWFYQTRNKGIDFVDNRTQNANFNITSSSVLVRTDAACLLYVSCLVFRLVARGPSDCWHKSQSFELFEAFWSLPHCPILQLSSSQPKTVLFTFFLSA